MDNTRRKGLVTLFLICFTHSIWAQTSRLNTNTPRDMTGQLFSPAEHAALGIVGNGINGIVGNGLLQQINQEHFVLNDRVYLTGPRSVRVMIDFQVGSLQDIGPGHVLQVTAQSAPQGDDFAPRNILLDSLIRGEVQSIETAESEPSFRVLNQLISLPDYALIYNGPVESDFDSIQPGNFVRINGWLDELGNPVVTRVDRLSAPPTSLEISGPVTAVNSNATELQINGLTIDYSTASMIDLDVGDLAESLKLEVTGTLLIDGDTLQATTIRPVALSLNQQSKHYFDVEGIVSAPADAFEVVINNQTFSYNTQTIFDRGTAADLVPGAIIEIDGRFVAADNSLVADKIRFNQELLESEIRIFAPIDSIDFDAQSFAILGLPVSYSVATRLDDHSGSSATVELIEQLNVGDYIEVRGYDQPDGQFMVAATRIIKEGADVSLLRARAAAVGTESLELLGRQVVTNNATRYEDSSGAEISGEQFFSAMQIESLVNAEVVASGEVLIAIELSFED